MVFCIRHQQHQFNLCFFVLSRPVESSQRRTIFRGRHCLLLIIVVNEPVLLLFFLLLLRWEDETKGQGKTQTFKDKEQNKEGQEAPQSDWCRKRGKTPVKRWIYPLWSKFIFHLPLSSTFEIDLSPGHSAFLWVWPERLKVKREAQMSVKFCVLFSEGGGGEIPESSPHTSYRS